ncbi:VOC family protein [Streptomyces sp. NPDC101152]|uniref:VOC family protein n=1 Tax=Streptomyces sp. NPDC101152 TaxID=3366116 RepID=UPI00380803B4
MSSLIRHVTIDAADPFVLAGFWAQALDGSLADDDFPGDPEAVVTTAAATLLFVRVG